MMTNLNKASSVHDVQHQLWNGVGGGDVSEGGCALASATYTSKASTTIG